VKDTLACLNRTPSIQRNGNKSEKANDGQTHDATKNTIGNISLKLKVIGFSRAHKTPNGPDELPPPWNHGRHPRRPALGIPEAGGG
jgi:hypothetical protein